MPMKWTPENDQKLLIKILETSNVTADVKAIATTWDPASEAPTARAVSERLVKIRSNCKANGGGSFKVASSQTKGNSTRAPKQAIGAPKTPRKKAEPKQLMTPTSSAGKRKRPIISDEDEDEDDLPVGSTPQDGIVIKDEPNTATSPFTTGGPSSFNSYAPTLDDSDGTPATPSAASKSFPPVDYGFNISSPTKKSKGNAGQILPRAETMDMAQYANAQGYAQENFLHVAEFEAFDHGHQQQGEYEEEDVPLEV